MTHPDSAWLRPTVQLTEIRITGLREENFEEDCLLGVCWILGVPHHAQFLKVHDVPETADSKRLLQTPTLDPHDRYADLQQIYPAGNYETVDLTRFGFSGRYVVLIHPFEA